jgi:hypothetical protein
MIPLQDCEDRFAYKIYSRNLIFGVFNVKNSGFIGIREKFGEEYLFTEYHYDTGSPFGTVTPKEKLIKAPDDIELREILCTQDKITGREVLFDKPISEGGKGWYFEDTGESTQNIVPVSVSNKKLFDWIKNLQL